MTPDRAPVAPGRMLRVPQVLAETGFSRTTLWRRVRAGDFPHPLRTGPNQVAWPEAAVEAWKRSLSYNNH